MPTEQLTPEEAEYTRTNPTTPEELLAWAIKATEHQARRLEVSRRCGKEGCKVCGKERNAR